MPPKKQVYTKKDPISHVLDRPDTWVGSVRSRNIEEFVVLDDAYHIDKRTINVSPAIIRMFIEPLSNIVDNVARSKLNKNPTTKIEIYIDKESGQISFWNDGDVVPVERHETEKCYNHTMIFGQLLTGSNYDDTQEREDISGRNGVGGKACNIFSKTFTVEGADPDNKKLFRQTWTNNMRNPSEPVISPYKEKKGYTKVFYTLDFARFGVEGYTDDIISLYKRLAVDASMVTKVPLFWNGEEIPVHSLVDYAKLFSGDEAETLFIKTKDCEVVISSSSEGESQTISFANGIYTPSGGTHVEAWSEAIFRPLIDKLNKPKKPQVNIGDVKKFFRLFVVATVKNPEFDSQSKFKLEAPQITAEVKKSHIATISRWTVRDRLEDIIRAKEMVVLKKAERKKRGYEKVEGLEPANNEGGSKSTECTLILVEGLSAKTYASWGIQRGAFGKKGRDWFGIFPLRGKVLNCRNAKPVTISKNKIVTDIIKALGIQYDLDYSIEENYKKLRYGRVMIICDADVDGHHISGLIQNMFHALFPTLLKRQVPFLTSMQTPIVRVYLGKTDKLFYDEQEYRKYVKTLDGKKINKKYYKGLGSSNEDDVAETFGQKLIEYKEDDHTFENMNKAFNTKFSDMRKEWLEHYDSSQTVLKWDGNKEEKLAITFSDYINTELIKFSLDDCKRSIPNIMDGLKEGHRKVLYVCFLNNIKHTGKTIKVAQLAGMVSHKAGYHHGEQNLEATMTHMANAYVGSNNIPLLFRDGQFGCLDPDTPVLAFDGSIKLAKDVRVGDLLIGDDGSKRTVTGLFSGEDNMYKVTQSYGDNYIVNSSHILTLRYSGNRCIYWKESSNCWYMEYYSTENKQIKYRTESVSLSVSKEDAYEKMFKLRETLPDTDIFDIKLGDYLKLAPSIKRKFKGVNRRVDKQHLDCNISIEPVGYGKFNGWSLDGNCRFLLGDFTVTHNSRAENGDDAAAGRYIWTKLDAMTRYIFREEDDMLLDYIEDDGDKVEPKFYVPIIPMILINGMTGIGTGWSSSIPSYNPLDIISAIKVWINNGHKAFDVTDDISISLLPELTPWYRGHTGDMTSEGDGKYTTWGRVDLDNKGKAHVSELPVGMSTSSFVDFLEEMKENKHISNYKNHSTPKDISFTITESSEGISCDVNNLKLFRHIRTTNMVAFTENGAIKKFNSAEEIIDSFCQVRYLYYVKRKERILKNLDRTIKILGNKKRFLQEVRDGIFKLFEDVKGKRQSRKTVDIIKELEQTGYDRDTDGEET
jgi:DNA gyrase/topoisomerase IV subunit B